MRPGVEHEVLALWENAAARPPFDRDDALLGGGAPLPSPGARHAALLRKRARLFGPQLALRGNCPHCAAPAEFGVDCEGLAAALLPAAEAASVQRLACDGWQLDFRLPTVDDLRAAAADAAALLQRCVLGGHDAEGRPADALALPAAVAEALSQRMEQLEPGASVGFDLVCPACAGAWSAPMDVGDVLWRELQAGAEQVLLDVDTLARAYGWREADVLALSPTRRAAYLQLVTQGP